MAKKTTKKDSPKSTEPIEQPKELPPKKLDIFEPTQEELDAIHKAVDGGIWSDMPRAISRVIKLHNENVKRRM